MVVLAPVGLVTRPGRGVVQGVAVSLGHATPPLPLLGAAPLARGLVHAGGPTPVVVDVALQGVAVGPVSPLVDVPFRPLDAARRPPTRRPRLAPAGEGRVPAGRAGTGRPDQVGPATLAATDTGQVGRPTFPVLETRPPSAPPLKRAFLGAVPGSVTPVARPTDDAAVGRPRLTGGPVTARPPETRLALRGLPPRAVSAPTVTPNNVAVGAVVLPARPVQVPHRDVRGETGRPAIRPRPAIVGAAGAPPPGSPTPLVPPDGAVDTARPVRVTTPPTAVPRRVGGTAVDASPAALGRPVLRRAATGRPVPVGAVP